MAVRCFCWRAARRFCQNQSDNLRPVLSVWGTLFLKPCSLFRCSFAKPVELSCLFIHKQTKTFSRRTFANKPYLLRLLLIVLSGTLTLDMLCLASGGWCAALVFFSIYWLNVAQLDLEVNLLRSPTVFYALHLWIMILTMKCWTSNALWMVVYVFLHNVQQKLLLWDSLSMSHLQATGQKSARTSTFVAGCTSADDQRLNKNGLKCLNANSRWALRPFAEGDVVPPADSLIWTDNVCDCRVFGHLRCLDLLS